MASDLSFACDCGTVTGAIHVISGEGDHLVCHCTDCQNLTHHLGHAQLLDAHGGTALYQTRCARVRIDTGRDHDDGHGPGQRTARPDPPARTGLPAGRRLRANA